MMPGPISAEQDISDRLETELDEVRSVLATTQAAVTNPEVDPQAISTTIGIVIQHIAILKSLCLRSDRLKDHSDAANYAQYICIVAWQTLLFVGFVV